MKKQRETLVLLCCLLTVLFIGFNAQPAQASKGKVKLVYVEWSCATASANVIKAVLQEKLGYTVKLLPVTAAAMWQAVATGAADGFTTAWLPTTHASYLAAVKDKVDNLGPNLKGTRIGLVVPAYVTIDSIEQLNANRSKFNGRIIGIDPGAGIMMKTEKAMEEYQLRRFHLVEGSGATMTAVLKDAIRNKEWAVVTGWTPHWMFGRWQLKYLDDPKHVYGGAEYINTIVRKGLKEDMPQVYAVLDNFSWSPEQLQQVMVMNQQDGSDPYANAVRWVNEHPEMVNKWLPK
ncbi:MAG: glycine/betaine ABC transporter substrate-binding protein [Desulfobacteraceae bacterium 4572_35.1]|nr:MAG: glycine/betaine ABC transporter substrate-binding protein [Desulfobacteraceae bacterium 4572_35.1]